MPVISLERLAFGGDAVGRLDGKAVFVPLGAPGDVATVDIVDDRTRWARARLVGLEQRGHGRVDPPCPHFATCGGCQWQHVGAPTQLETKRDIVADHLARIGGLRDTEVLPLLAGPPWKYRDRVTLACRADRIGLRGFRSHDLAPIATCEIASAAIVAALPAATAVHPLLGDDLRRITIVGGDDGVVLVASGGRPTPAAARRACAAGAPIVRGLVWRGSGRRITTGDIRVRRTLEPALDVLVPADAFMQVSGWAHATLVAEVIRLAGPIDGAAVLDLYCGAGTLSLPLARRGAHVHGIEREPIAVAAARSNAERLGLSTFTAVSATVSHGLATAPDADVVILDPPRRGAADVVDALLVKRPRRVVYLSCDPATFARDVGRLVRGGYRLEPVQPIDVFPQTYHVEIAAGLQAT